MIAAPPRGCEVEAAIFGRARELHATLSLVALRSDCVAHAAGIICEALAAGRLVLACGNGGSAAEAQHLVAELVGRFRRERDPWSALALTADSSVLTAIGNDYGFESVFARQVTAFGRPGDVLVGFSTSGESMNVINAARAARGCGMSVVALTGREPSPFGRHADIAISVPADDTALVQEVHGVLVHVISEIVESRLAGLAVRKDPSR
jgi:D-sedoheptulose 7-phosphate isomerase